MNINILNSQFHKGAEKYNTQIKTLKEWKLIPIQKFPLTKFITQGDLFFEQIWRIIDNSKDYFWMTTYAIDSSPVTNATLYKLIDAAKRGVHVVLFVDYVQSWVKGNLVEQFCKAGGKYMVLNPQSLNGYLTKDVWRRHHEKLIVSDDKSIIGSSNIQQNYAGLRYGNEMFRDINFYSQNIILDQYRKYFVETANRYNFNLSEGEIIDDENLCSDENTEFLQKLDKQYGNSQFYEKDRYRLLCNDQSKNIKQIEQDIIKKMRLSKTEIKIIQPYYYPISRFQRMVQKVLKKNKIMLQVITSGERDQLAYKYLKNQMLFSKLLKMGIKLYQTRNMMLHSKVYMFDRRWISLGSMNNDRWSWLINNECNIMIDNERLYEEINEYYEKLKKMSKEVKKYYRINASQAAYINFWQWFLHLSEIVMRKNQE